VTAPPAPWMDDDALIASVDLVGRTGARDLEIGHNGDGEDGEAWNDVRWHAVCGYAGTRIIEDGHPNPVAAVEALARRLLTGGTCIHCRGLIALSDHGAVVHPGAVMADGSTMTVERARSLPQCRWHRQGARWVRGCEDTHPHRPSGTVTVTGPQPTRRERRAFRRGRRRG
jgi:hypothetical protein